MYRYLVTTAQSENLKGKEGVHRHCGIVRRIMKQRRGGSGSLCLQEGSWGKVPLSSYQLHRTSSEAENSLAEVDHEASQTYKMLWGASFIVASHDQSIKNGPVQAAACRINQWPFLSSGSSGLARDSSEPGPLFRWEVMTRQGFESSLRRSITTAGQGLGRPRIRQATASEFIGISLYLYNYQEAHGVKWSAVRWFLCQKYWNHF